jgi:Kdo2-lipid IVA lauroyltransferase/acyltransferase
VAIPNRSIVVAEQVSRIGHSSAVLRGRRIVARAAAAAAAAAALPRLLRLRRCRAAIEYWVIDPAVGGLTLAVYYLLRTLPIDWCSAVGGMIGVLIGRYCERAAWARARHNYLRLSSLPPSETDADAAMTRLWQHIGRLLAETAVLDRLWQAGRIEVNGLHHLAAARDAGRPHLMMGLHLGTWEVFGAAMYALGFPGKFIYLPPRNRFQDRIARRVRKHWGKALPLTVGGLREAHRTLVEERGAVVMLVDEFIKGRGVLAPLFGRPIASRSNLSNAVRLTLASGGALLPFYVERLRGGARFRLTILPEVELIRSGESHADVIENIRSLDRLITRIITERLEQWFLLPYLHLE